MANLTPPAQININTGNPELDRILKEIIDNQQTLQRNIELVNGEIK